MSDIIACYSKCWPCNFGECPEPAEWHGWADFEDIEHAEATGQDVAALKAQRCGCYCMGGVTA